jgi:subtilase family serine protease
MASMSHFNKFFTRKPQSKNRTRPLSALSTLIELLEDRSVPAVMTPDFSLHLPTANTTTGPTGLTPTEIRGAYNVNAVAFGSIVGDGSGQTIAIVDAYNQPDIASDLAAFDAAYGLSAPGSFTVINENGGTALPAADAKGGWGVETSLDVEWAHVIAPKANIVLVEASSANDGDLYKAVDTARNYAGVSVVSMSWGGSESASDISNNSHFTTPSGHIGVTFVASSGDEGAYASGSNKNPPSVEYPAASPNVVAVGGTTLSATAAGSYLSESGWGNGTSSATSGGSGGGISQYETQPSYQQGTVTQSTTKRTVPDVSMDADPNSGVAVFDTYDEGTAKPWIQVGGTSLAAPMFAGIVAIADQGRVLAGSGTLDGSKNTLPAIYTLPSSDFHDVTTGNNGYAASAGYDLVTGRGSPIANVFVAGLVGGSTVSPPSPPITAPPVLGSFAVNPTSVVTGSTITLTASGVTETNGTITSVKFYRESNGTSGLQTGSDVLIGTGTQSGTTWTLSSATTGLAAGTYTYYAVATDANGVSTTAATATLTVTSPPPVVPPVVPPVSPPAKAATTSTLSGTVTPIGFNSAQVTLTDTITVAPGQAPPTGVVNFYWNGTLLGTATLTTVNGLTTASLTVIFRGYGYASFSASYGGNSQYAGSTSNTASGYV